MIDDWPDDVLEHAVRRNLILIVGAGVSRNAIDVDGNSPPDWRSLLESAASKIRDEELDAELSVLFRSGRYLDAAELIRQRAKSASKEQTIHNHIRDTVDGRSGKKFEGGPWHEAVVRMEPQVIVTTNYDNVLERATSHGYATHVFDSSSVASDLRRATPILLKIHGTVDHIESIVLSRTDYSRLRVEGRHALEVLQALLLTRVALFIGYSLRDPDVQLLLENNFGATGSSPAHYILMSDDLPEYEREILRYSYGVTPIVYPSDDRSYALNMLTELADLVQSSKISP